MDFACGYADLLGKSFGWLILVYNVQITMPMLNKGESEKEREREREAVAYSTEQFMQ